MNTQELFFDLIRSSLGDQESLSRFPSEPEWDSLLQLAVKQSLVGVCFLGIHRLGADSDEGYARIGMSENLFYTWMSMAVQISMKNEAVNQRCADLQKQLAADGFRSCVLKGQGVAQLYAKELCELRQSGDIDIWIDAPREKIINYVIEKTGESTATLLHVNLPLFNDIEVEAHFMPTDMIAPVYGRRLRAFYEAEKSKQMENICRLPNGSTICAPTASFNAVYILNHALSHFLFEGVGLRQMMDYYFVLQQPLTGEEKESVVFTLKRTGMYRFARCVAFVLEEVFGATNMFILPDKKLGKRVLGSIMQEGNFGKYDKKRDNGKMGRSWYRFYYHTKRQLSFFCIAPWLILTSPVMRLYEYIWRLSHGYFKRNSI